MGFPKLSMLAFYWAYFPLAARPGLRKMLAAATAFVVACYLAILFDDTFFCGADVAVQWSPEEGACSVFYATPPFILNFTLNLACYLCGEQPPFTPGERGPMLTCSKPSVCRPTGLPAPRRPGVVARRRHDVRSGSVDHPFRRRPVRLSEDWHGPGEP